MIENTNVKSKLVFDPLTARALLKRGMKVIDCKPLKNDKKKTILVFEDTVEFRKALAEISNELGLVCENAINVEDPRIARALLKKQAKLIDYRLMKIEDKSKMVFVFENTDGIEEAIAEIVAALESKEIAE